METLDLEVDKVEDLVAQISHKLPTQVADLATLLALPEPTDPHQVHYVPGVGNYRYEGGWRLVGGGTVLGSSPPTSPLRGQRWFNLDTARTYTWFPAPGAWVELE